MKTKYLNGDKDRIIKRVKRRAKTLARKLYQINTEEYNRIVEAWVTGYLACEADYEKWRVQSMEKNNW